jgi:hypothetical protein
MAKDADKDQESQSRQECGENFGERDCSVVCSEGTERSDPKGRGCHNRPAGNGREARSDRSSQQAGDQVDDRLNEEDCFARLPKDGVYGREE